MDEQEIQGTDSSQETADSSFVSKLRNMLGLATSTDSEAGHSSANNLDPFAEKPNSQRATNQQSGTAAPSANSQPAPAGDDLRAFSEYASTRDFVKDVPVEDDTFTDQRKLASYINQVTQKAYSTAMIDATRVFQKALDDRFQSYDSTLDDRINSVSRGQINYDRAVNELPLMRDKTTAPIVTSVLNGFLRQGQDVNTALDNTRTYLQNLSNKVNTPKTTQEMKHSRSLDELFDGLISK